MATCIFVLVPVSVSSAQLDLTNTRGLGDIIYRGWIDLIYFAYSSDTTSRYVPMSSVSTAESDGRSTPTHTITSGEANSYTSMGMQEPTFDARALPSRNMTFIIRDPKTHRIISLKEGAPKMVHLDIFHYQYNVASHWHCVENEMMWLGFYNDVSGTYLGHDSNDGIRARATKHNAWEWFCPRQHPDGGQLLLIKDDNGFSPMKIGGKENMELVVDSQRREGTMWEFIRIDTGS